MSTNLSSVSTLLRNAGVRHHVDVEEAAIRVLFVTRYYTNPRGERLVIVQIEVPDGGRRLRASIPRAFARGRSPAAMCAALCRLAAETPLVGVEYDAAAGNLRLVVETPVEDGRIRPAQVLAMIDGLVEAAETWHVALGRGSAGGRRRPRYDEPRAA